MISAQEHDEMTTTPTTSRDARTRGYSLLELIVALSMVGSAMTTIAPVLLWANAQRRAAAARQFAVCEASNVLERIAGDEGDDVTQEKADAVRLSDEARVWLPSPRLAVTVAAETGPPSGRRVTVELRWKNPAGDDESPVRLTGFVFRQGSAP